MGPGFQPLLASLAGHVATEAGSPGPRPRSKPAGFIKYAAPICQWRSLASTSSILGNLADDTMKIERVHLRRKIPR